MMYPKDTVEDESRRSLTEDVESKVSSPYEIGKAESRQVFLQKVLVIIVLFLAAAAISGTVYTVTKRAELREFKTHFQGSADKISSSFDSIVSERLGAVGSLCLALTAQGLNLNNSWPFVTMDAFQERATNARILSNVLHMSLLPIVSDDNRKEWEEYSVRNGDWYVDGFAYQKAIEENGFSINGVRRRGLATEENTESFDLFNPKVFDYTPSFEVAYPNNTGPYAPVWQSAPVTALDGVNLNIRSLFPQGLLVEKTMETDELVLGGFFTSSPGDVTHPNVLTSWYASLLSTAAGKPIYYSGDPITEATYPIFSSFDSEDKQLVAVMIFQFAWNVYFEGLLTDNSKGLILVLENACDGNYTYQVDGASVKKLGFGDLHDDKFGSLRSSTYLSDDFTLNDGSRSGVKLNQNGCPYSLHVYPSQAMFNVYNTHLPMVITLCIVFIFVFTAVMFVVYDRLVEKRQRLIESTAKQSTEIVGSLFPENVRDRLLQAGDDFLSPNQRLQNYLKGNTKTAQPEKMKPIADVFPFTTVMFADIVGFTAWSSTREPSQVFVLLQAVYQAFDIIAKKCKVFKVETIGDSYVAVAGLPNPQPDHAVIMAKFAWACHKKLIEVVRELEVVLGPQTTDLTMRFGLHSGPVTAGVLRGDSSLVCCVKLPSGSLLSVIIGNTVNVASRMESTGMPSMIQVSHTTANHLVLAEKSHWLERRENAVVAKGKGVLNTFWVHPYRQEGEGTDGISLSLTPAHNESELKLVKQARLVSWMSDLLLRRLKEIVVRRKTLNGGDGIRKGRRLSYHQKKGQTALDEVVEVIELPDFDRNAVSRLDASDVTIPETVVDQLREHVATIAAAYRDNHFHNFEHACHVAMSVDKFLRRIVSGEIDVERLKGRDARSAVASQLHDYTYGINSDPVALFGIVYAALIHDVDHRGVSNNQLMKEEKQMAAMYKNKSVAEQHSLALSWAFLMSPGNEEFRRYLFGNDMAELEHLRQVVVNVVLATDIFDKELNDLRRNRWDKAFHHKQQQENQSLRATIVIEHIIQASDVSHTMQHWHVFRKWNERLFHEMYTAFTQGRMGSDPSTFWYKGELGFFDNYVIPLARKLKECNVFGVSSDECLMYALQNRAEWEERGEELVEKMIENFASLEVQRSDADVKEIFA